MVVARLGKLAGLCKWARISRECFKQTQQDALFKNSEMKHFPFLPPPLHFLPGRKKKHKQTKPLFVEVELEQYQLWPLPQSTEAPWYPGAEGQESPQGLCPFGNAC